MTDGTPPDDVRERIAAALDDVERHEGVRILLAVESGSRAWGFPSRDSDWDVRFLYVRPLAAYLSAAPRRDTAERAVEDGLDLGGWDLRKALGLIAKSNAPALEWLVSPFVYRREEDVAAELAGIARDAAHLPALEYHYGRLARGSWATGEGPVRLKSVFYALRPALALAWMRRHGTAPPMDLPSLMAGLDLPASFISAVEVLRCRKATGTEADMAPRCPVVAAFLAEMLAMPPSRPAAWERSHVLARADALLLKLVAGEGRT